MRWIFFPYYRKKIQDLLLENQDLLEQNNNWSLKYQKLKQEKSELMNSIIKDKMQVIFPTNFTSEVFYRNSAPRAPLSTFVGLIAGKTFMS